MVFRFFSVFNAVFLLFSKVSQFFKDFHDIPGFFVTCFQVFKMFSGVLFRVLVRGFCFAFCVECFLFSVSVSFFGQCFCLCFSVFLSWFLSGFFQICFPLLLFSSFFEVFVQFVCQFQFFF